MKCPHCGAWSSVSDSREGVPVTTRKRKDAAPMTVRRHRECANGHGFVTVEVHLAVWGTLKSRNNEFVKTAARRAEMWHRDRVIAAELHLGWQRLAMRYGLSRTGVYLAAKRGRMDP